MGYSTKQEVIEALANALSQGSPDQPGVLVEVTTVGKTVSDTVSDEQLYQYIRWADENLDAAISSIYTVPLKRVNRGSYDLAMDVTAGDTMALLSDATRFTIGDVVLIRNEETGEYQEMTVSGTPVTTYVGMIELDFTTPIINSYPMLTTKIERIRYPEPIPKMSARLAAAYLYDKHFAAQVQGNQSEFGKYLRELVYQDLNGILAGTVRLLIPDAGMYVGRRYYNPALDDVISTKAKPGDAWYKAGA